MRSSLPRAGGSVISTSLFFMRTESSVRLSLLTKDKIYASGGTIIFILILKVMFHLEFK